MPDAVSEIFCNFAPFIPLSSLCCIEVLRQEKDKQILKRLKVVVQ